MAQAGSVVVDFVANFKGFLKNLSSSISRMQGLSAAAGLARGNLLAFAGGVTTVTFVLAQAIREAMRFEEQMAQVETMLIGGARDYLPSYAAQVETLSAKFAQSTGALADGLYSILSAAIPTSEAMEVLEQSALAATAGLTNTGVAADSLTSLINSYGVSATRAAEINDYLFATVRRGKLNFQELAQAIGRVAPTADMANLSMDELFASISVMTRAGISASEATTSLNAIVRSFVRPTDDAQEAAKRLGFELSSATLASEGMIGVLKRLQGASAEQVAAVIPQIRALKGFNAMLRNTSGYVEDLALLQNKLGMTMIAAEKIMATTAFKAKSLWRMLLNLARTTGTVLLPFVDAAVGVFYDFARTVENLSDTVLPPIIGLLSGALANVFGAITTVVEKTADAIAYITERGGLLSSTMRALVGVLSPAISVFAHLLSIFLVIKGAILAYNAALWLNAAASSAAYVAGIKLFSSLNSIGNTYKTIRVSLIALNWSLWAQVDALKANIVAWYTQSEAMIHARTSVVYLKKAYKAVANSISAFSSSLKRGIVSLYETAAGSKAVKAVMAFFPNLYNSMAASVSTYTAALRKNIVAQWQTALSAESFSNSFVYLDTLVNKVGKTVKRFYTSLRGGIGHLLAHVEVNKIFGNSFAYLSNISKRAMSAIGSYYTTLKGGIVTTWANVTSGQALSDVITYLSGAYTRALTTANSYYATLVRGAKTTWANVAGNETLNAVITYISGVYAKATTAVASYYTSLKSGVAATWLNVTSGETLNTVITYISGAYAKATTAIASYYTTLKNGVAANWGMALSAESITRMMDGLGNAIQNTIKYVVNYTSALKTNIANVVSNIDVGKLFTGVLDSIKTAYSVASKAAIKYYTILKGALADLWANITGNATLSASLGVVTASYHSVTTSISGYLVSLKAAIASAWTAVASNTALSASLMAVKTASWAAAAGIKGIAGALWAAFSAVIASTGGLILIFAALGLALWDLYDQLFGVEDALGRTVGEMRRFRKEMRNAADTAIKSAKDIANSLDVITIPEETISRMQEWVRGLRKARKEAQGEEFKPEEHIKSQMALQYEAQRSLKYEIEADTGPLMEGMVQVGEDAQETMDNVSTLGFAKAGVLDQKGELLDNLDLWYDSREEVMRYQEEVSKIEAAGGTVGKTLQENLDQATTSFVTAQNEIENIYDAWEEEGIISSKQADIFRKRIQEATRLAQEHAAKAGTYKGQEEAMRKLEGQLRAIMAVGAMEKLYTDVAKFTKGVKDANTEIQNMIGQIGKTSEEFKLEQMQKGVEDLTQATAEQITEFYRGRPDAPIMGEIDTLISAFENGSIEAEEFNKQIKRITQQEIKLSSKEMGIAKQARRAGKNLSKEMQLALGQMQTTGMMPELDEKVALKIRAQLEEGAIDVPPEVENLLQEAIDLNKVRGLADEWGNSVDEVERYAELVEKLQFKQFTNSLKEGTEELRKQIKYHGMSNAEKKIAVAEQKLANKFANMESSERARAKRLIDAQKQALKEKNAVEDIASLEKQNNKLSEQLKYYGMLDRHKKVALLKADLQNKYAGQLASKQTEINNLIAERKNLLQELDAIKIKEDFMKAEEPLKLMAKQIKNINELMQEGKLSPEKGKWYLDQLGEKLGLLRDAEGPELDISATGDFGARDLAQMVGGQKPAEETAKNTKKTYENLDKLLAAVKQKTGNVFTP